MEPGEFLPPWERPRANRRARKYAADRRHCCSLCSCSSAIVACAGLAVVAVVIFGAVYILDRLQRLESVHADRHQLYDTFRSERIECFYMDRNKRTFVIPAVDATSASAVWDDALERTVEYADAVTGPNFNLSGYTGQLLVYIARSALPAEYLYVKYRPIGGDTFPMQKKISLRLMHPNNPQLSIQKQFNTPEEIDKGALMFARPNGEFWGANFCAVAILNRFVNNRLICVAVTITDLVTYN